MEIKELKCLRCNHTWISRLYKGGIPKSCPSCKSPYWNKPKTRKAKLKQIGG